MTTARRRRRLGVPYPLPTEPPWNAPHRSPLPTPDGTESALHFSALDFGPGESFGGYRFWLGGTPYYNINYQIEDPCLWGSHDGYHWEVPSGLVNPVFPTPPGLDYNSDIDIAHDPTTGLLHMWWREASPNSEFAAGQGRVALVHSTSPDGVAWAPKDTTLEWTGMSIAEVGISPSVVRVSDTEWHMHTGELDWSGGGGYLCRRTAASPNGPWSAPVSWSFTTSAGRAPWHLEVTLCSDGIHRALIADGSAGPLHAASSPDGLVWTGADGDVLGRRPGMWDQSLYRGSMTEHEDGGRFRVWYSGRLDQWHLGYTEIPISEWPTPI